MFCPFCGKEIEDQSKFCTYCGKATQIPQPAAPEPPAPAENAADTQHKPKKEKKQKPPKQSKQPSVSAAEPEGKRRLNLSIGTVWMTAFILLELLPYLLRSVIMLATKTVLSVPVMCLSILLGYAAMFGALTLMTKLRRGKAAVPAALLFTSVFALRRISEPFILSLTESGKTLQTVIGYTAEGIVCIAAAFILAAALRPLSVNDEQKRGGTAAAVLFSLLSFAVIPALQAGYYFMPFEHIPSFLSTASSKLLFALAEAGCFTLAARAIAGSKQKESTPARAGKGALIAGGACAAASAVLLTVGSMPQNVMKSMTNDVVYPFVQAELFLASGDMTYAVRFYNLAGEHAKAWSTLAQGSSYSMSPEYPTDTTLRYLAYLNSNGEDMKNYMRNDFDPDEIGFFGPLMLDCYKQRNTLDENEEAHRREVIDLCIGSDTFVNKYPTMKMIAKHSDELRDLSKADTVYGKYLRLAGIFEDIQKNDASVSSSINALLDLAEEYPQDIKIQVIASIIGSENKWDSAGHYERTGEAVLRFLRCVDNAPETFSDNDTVIGLRNTGADMLMNVNQFDKAADVLNATLEKDAGNSSAKQMLARCYMELGDHAKSRQLAKEVSDANPQDVTALWTLCVCALKKGDNAEAIGAAARLADAVSGGRTEGDSLLFNCATELSMQDRTAGYTHNLYTNDPEDENVKLIAENEFLNDYCAAIYYSKMKREYELALEHVDRALKGREQLSRLWYLKGVIHYSLKQFEESEKALLKADELDPNDLSIMYALVNTYDGMGEYKKAYEYCERVVAKYPNGADHDEDVFGAMPHASMILGRLRSLAEEGE